MFSSFRDGQHKPGRGLLLTHLLLGSGVLRAGVYDRFEAYIRHHFRPENIRSCWRGFLIFANYRKSSFFVLQRIFLYLEGRLPLWHLHVDSMRQHD